MRYGRSPWADDWLICPPAEDGIDAGDRRDHVGEHPTLAECGQRLQVVERRVPHVDPVGTRPAVADDVAAQLALGDSTGTYACPAGTRKPSVTSLKW